MTRFLVLGEVGAGKTTLLNYIVNYFEGEKNFEKIVKDPRIVKLAFKTQNWEDNVLKRFSDMTDEQENRDKSFSQTTNCFEFELTSKNKKTKLSFIDTPGFNDTDGVEKDNENLSKIVKAILREKTLNGIILVMNGTNARFNSSLRNFISLLKGFLPEAFIDNTILILTNCDEQSKNFNTQCLKDIINYKKLFTMQNTLFRWDKGTKKNLRFYKQNWEESQSTLGSILEVLKMLPSVPTKTFKMTQEIANKLNSDIKRQIKKVISLLATLNEIEINKETINRAIENMAKNSEHEVAHKIKVIPFKKHNEIVRPKENKKNDSSQTVFSKFERTQKRKSRTVIPKDRKELFSEYSDHLNRTNEDEQENKDIEMVNSESEFIMTLPNNIAVHQYTHANVEKEEAEAKLQVLKEEANKIEKTIEKDIENIGTSVQELRFFCSGFNIAETVEESMSEFSKLANQTKNEKFLRYFEMISYLLYET